MLFPFHFICSRPAASKSPAQNPIPLGVCTVSLSYRQQRERETKQQKQQQQQQQHHRQLKALPCPTHTNKTINNSPSSGSII